MNIEQLFARTRHAHGAEDRAGARTVAPATGKPLRLPFALTLGEAWEVLLDVVFAAVCAGAYFWAWFGPTAGALAAALVGALAGANCLSQIRQPWRPDSCRPRPPRRAWERKDTPSYRPRTRKQHRRDSTRP